jgi:hypothetical protein
MGVEGLPIVENYTEPEAVMQQVTRDLKRCINTMYPKATRTRLLTIQRTCLLQVRYLAHLPISNMPPSALCPLPSALCPLPSALYPLPSALCPLPSALCPLPSALYPLSSTLYPLPSALYPLPSTLCPLPFTLCPLPSALNPRLTRTPKRRGVRIIL